MPEPGQVDLALGLEEPEVIETPEVTPEITPEVTTPPAPTDAELLQKERERVARLEGELSVLTRQPVAPAQQTATPVKDSYQQIQTDYDEGKINDDERSRRRIAIDVDRRFEENQIAAEQISVVNSVREELGQAIVRYPDLGVARSPMILEVDAELLAMRKMGIDTNDERNQLIAVRKIIALKEVPMTDRRYEQTQHPIGGGGGMSPAETPPIKNEDNKSKGEKLFERMNKETQAFYMSYHNGDTSKIYSALDHADEGKLIRGGRFR